MIQAQRLNDRVTISVSADRRPRLYFDQFALYELAKPEHSGRFFRRFETHGELLFSHINMLEVGMLRDPSAARVQGFLRRIGLNWAPLNCEFSEVVVRENEGEPEDPHPALSGSLGKLVYDLGGPNEPMTLDRIVNAFRGADMEAHRHDLHILRAGIGKQVEDWQKLSPEQMDRQYPVVASAGPTLYLSSRLVRALITEARAFHWTPNDALDFIHAIVPLVYADAVFLDRQWRERIKRLELEGPFATIFSGNDFGRFLDWFDGFTPPAEVR